jgi:hypothetical protein
MTESEYQAILAGMPRVYHVILAELKGHDVMTAPQLRRPTGRPDGLTVELRRLQSLGFVRAIGPVPKPTDGTRINGIRPMQYQYVRPADVEEAREAHASAKRRMKKRKVVSFGARERELQVLAREEGEYGAYYQQRTNTIRYGHSVKLLGTQAFWDAAPRYDLARQAEEIVEIIECSFAGLEALALRAKDDEEHARIEKIMRSNGRTPEELDSFRNVGEKLKKKLLPRKSA